MRRGEDLLRHQVRTVSNIQLIRNLSLGNF